jgi:glycosyltransferase involved in cell wall biosynthesis
MTDISIPLALTKADSLLQPRKPLSSTGELQLVEQVPTPIHVVPSVAVLLCIYNGKDFLAEQLESIDQQTHQNWRLFISDDGDCQESLQIIATFSARFERNKVNLVSGPKKGFAKNFLSLICDKLINAEYFAFCDQDDIWSSKKLEKAITSLENIDHELPSLYCSRVNVVNKRNEVIGLSPLFLKPPCFSNALVQTIGGGNTMVFNQAARNLVLRSGSSVDIVSHDWWMYLLVSGCNGYIYFDDFPSVRYRQHENNLRGSNLGFIAKIVRIKQLLRGDYKNFITTNLKALEPLGGLFLDKNLIFLNEFSAAREYSFFKRVKKFYQLKIYRQTILGNIGLWLAVLFNKL